MAAKNGRLMQAIRCAYWILIFCVFPRWLVAEHGPLLPRPQQIQYGPGHLLVRNLSIRLASPTPTEEDRFAASELVRRLEARTGVPVRMNAEGDGPAIVLNRTGDVDPLPMPGEQPGPDSREAYHLKVSSTGVEIRGGSSSAVFYGVQTLVQLVEGQGAEASLPEVEIHDWPVLAYRGVMMDMSHGPLPTEQEVERQLDFLALFKTNQYYFYNEASVALEGYPLLNPKGRFSQEQVRRIVTYGRERHIDIIPCLELYGHLHDLFRVEKYSDLSDLPHGTEFNPSNPKAKALLADWASQFAQLFPSRFVHIGFDETFQIEVAARQAGGTAPAKLFIEQLNYVAGLFRQKGKTVMAWGDIMVKYPGITAELPPGLMAVAWEYDPGTPERYEHWLKPLAEHHVPNIIATGVTSWNSVAPDYFWSFDNIDTFLSSGRKFGTIGIMNTIWTDDGQMLMRTTDSGLAYGAAAGWQSSPLDHGKFFGEYARLLYPTGVAPDVASALDDLAQSEVELQKVVGHDSMLALWTNPFAAAMLEKCTAHRDELRKTRLLAEDAEEHLAQALQLGGDPVALNSLLFSSRLLDYAGQRFQTAPELEDMWRRLGPTVPNHRVFWNEWDSQVTYQDHSRLVDLMDAITELREDYRSGWLAEYMPYRLASALGRWDAEYEYWRQFQSRLKAFSETAREGSPLPPLESLAPSR